jgi:hypothetical protein
LTCTSGCPAVAGAHHWQPRLMARRSWWSWCAHGSGGCRAVPYAGLGAPDDRHRPARRGPACAGRASRRLSPALTPAQRRRAALISYTAGFGSGSDPGRPNSLREKPTVSQAAPYALPHRRTRVPFRRPGRSAAPRVHLPNRRVTTQGRALRASGPELDDMNAAITAGRSSWRALIFGDLKLFEPKTMCPFLAVRDREER